MPVTTKFRRFAWNNRHLEGLGSLLQCAISSSAACGEIQLTAYLRKASLLTLSSFLLYRWCHRHHYHFRLPRV